MDHVANRPHGAKKTTKNSKTRRAASKRTAGQPCQASPGKAPRPARTSPPRLNRSTVNGAINKEKAPTRAQRDALKQAKALARRACLLANSRRGTPEAAALDFIASALLRANFALLRAHEEGRDLRCVHVGGGFPPALVHGRAPAQVIPIAPYLAARRGGAHG
ncbi:hypothetical protein [Sorangium sp. So ce426]|uniref:hypothetical protein n=1 Tax=Sorangium sp. So ce426 TaxID=3133312 RepID=UPI003F5C3F47